MQPIRKLLSCNNMEDYKSNAKGGRKAKDEPFETMENLEVTEIDGYLNAVLSRVRRSQGDL